MNRKKALLIVDDDKINRVILQKNLADTYIVLEAENGQEALEILNRENGLVSAVIVDLTMPGMDGYELLEAMRSTPKLSDIPVIVTTAKTDSQSELKAFKLGAWDYVVKPYVPEIINIRLKNAIDRSQLNRYKIAGRLAGFDALTGIYNKGKMLEQTRRLLQENQGEKFVFVRMDIDRFQLINNFFGEKEGDRLLKYIGSELGNLAKEQSMAVYGRIEADIFCMCIPYESAAVEVLMEKIQIMLREYNVSYDLVPSIGLYIIEDTGISINNILDCATLAAKKCKGNYVRFYAYYDSSMSEALVHEQQMVNDMSAALAEEQFEVYLQPKYNCQTNVLNGAEALVRWFHPDKGMISPEEFVPVFEKNGMISKLDYYVWEKVCVLLRRWMDEGRDLIPVSVNVSRVNVYNSNITDDIIQLVSKYKIPKELFQLELTESAYTDNPEIIREIMNKLQEQGFCILMDDFGSGYSSLNVLKDINIDILKIDLQFLVKSEVQGRAERILASVVQMAKWLKIPVIAEGVETQEQALLLRSIGCESVQGYYFARPMPITEFEKLLESRKPALGENIDELKEILDIDSLWTDSTPNNVVSTLMCEAAGLYGLENERLSILRVNDGYFRLMGQEDRAVRSAEPILEVEEHYRQMVLDKFREAVKTQKTVQFEYARHRFNDSNIWVRIRLKYIAQLGAQNLLFGVLENVTMQKKLEEELQSINVKMQELLDSIPGGVFKYSADEKEEFTFISNNFLKILGYTREEFMKKFHNCFSNMVYHEDLDRIQKEISEQIAVSDTDTCKYRIEDRSGKLRWFLEQGHLLEEDGRKWFYVTVIEIPES